MQNILGRHRQLDVASDGHMKLVDLTLAGLMLQLIPGAALTVEASTFFALPDKPALFLDVTGGIALLF